MSFFKDLVHTVVRGALAYYTAGLSEVAFRSIGPKNEAGDVGGAIGSVLGNTFGGGDNVTGTDGPQQSKITNDGVEKAANQMQQTNISPDQKPGGLKGVVGWMQENPELTQMIGSGIANMFTPDEIDVMREKAKLASRNYDGSGLVNLQGRSGSFGQRADQARSNNVRGDYTEESGSAESIDPFVGAGERSSVFNSMQQQRYNTKPQEYYDSLRKNRGMLSANMRRF